MKRKLTSLFMLFVFVVLCASGVLSYFTEYTRSIATIHTTFGVLFILIALGHMLNNYKALQKYSRSWMTLGVFGLVGSLAYLSVSGSSFSESLMNYGAKSKARIGIDSDAQSFTEIEMSLDKEIQLSLELKKAKHFWHPQIAVWTEDTLGNYIETLFVTKATAKGIFSGGRTKSNFKTLDVEVENKSGAYRRVNALSVWSHKRGVVYEDGLTVPTYDNPLHDGISGATPLGNFSMTSSVDYKEAFVLKLEINVAFDDNEYYSEYDFANDEVFHNGTGQLGQPSLIYSSLMTSTTQSKHFLMNIDGHGHHSGRDGTIYADLSKLTTALDVIDYVVVGIKNKS